MVLPGTQSHTETDQHCTIARSKCFDTCTQAERAMCLPAGAPRAGWAVKVTPQSYGHSNKVAITMCNTHTVLSFQPQNAFFFMNFEISTY